MISTSVRHAIVSNRNGIDDKGHELDELDASPNPDIGHNGSPDRCRSGP